MSTRLKLFALLVMVALLALGCAPAEELAEGDPSAPPATTGGDAATGGGGSEDEGGSEATSPSGGGGGGEPIRIGLLAPQTGTLAALGADELNGWNLFFEQNGTTFGGVEVETVTGDDAGDPAIAVQQAQRLVEDEEVDMIVGPIAANTALAVCEYAIGEGLPCIQPIASADDLTQRAFDPLLIRVGSTSSSQTGHAAGQYAYDQGYRRAVTIGPDYAFGHETVGGFAQTFTEAGGEIIAQLWNPLGTQDFSPYVTQIQGAAPDLVFAVETGGDAPRFLQAYQEFGLKGSIPLLGGYTIVEQAVLRSMGDEALGVESLGYYAETRDAPGTQEFVQAYGEAYGGQLPSLYSAGPYTAAQFITRAIEELNGDISDTDAFVETMGDIVLEDTPFTGPYELDEYNNPIYDVYVRSVERDDQGRLVNVIQETIEDVSQFWTYDPEAFLARPVYSRDFQGGPIE
jgi:branched-chain amino acid transport system substrate-binding protein